MSSDGISQEPKSIADWRKLIDAIDEQIVALLNERAQAAQEIGRIKARSTLPIYEPDRERAVLVNVTRYSRGPLPAEELHRIFERIMDVMRKMQTIDTQRNVKSQAQGEQP